MQTGRVYLMYDDAVPTVCIKVYYLATLCAIFYAPVHREYLGKG